MNILIYIPGLAKEYVGGVWQYSTALIKILAGDHSNKYFVYHNVENPEILQLVKSFPHLRLVKDADIREKKSLLLKRIINKTTKLFYINKRFTLSTLTDQLCAQFNIDIVHCPVQFIPVTKNAKLITTLHDVQEIHLPENFLAEDRAYRATAYLDFVRRANAIVVSYEHVKQDLIRYFQVEAAKIRVILLDMQKLWFERFGKEDILDISFMGLPQKFLLYPANTWKHKNHLRLIEAVAYAREKNGIVINLVCTGGNTDNHYSEIDRLVTKLALQNQVYFTGAVSEDILYSIYKTCRGVVIPTLYEAGSFPLMESILLNVPVICSNVTSLPETIGSDEFTFDPVKIDQMAALMARLWADDEFVEKNLSTIKGQVPLLRHNNSLEKLMNLYSSLAN